MQNTRVDAASYTAVTVSTGAVGPVPVAADGLSTTSIVLVPAMALIALLGVLCY
jgi:hypothetical protein